MMCPECGTIIQGYHNPLWCWAEVHGEEIVPSDYTEDYDD